MVSQNAMRYAECEVCWQYWGVHAHSQWQFLRWCWCFWLLLRVSWEQLLATQSSREASSREEVPPQCVHLCQSWMSALSHLKAGAACACQLGQKVHDRLHCVNWWKCWDNYCWLSYKWLLQMYKKSFTVEWNIRIEANYRLISAISPYKIKHQPKLCFWADIYQH